MSWLSKIIGNKIPAAVGIQPDGKLSPCDPNHANCVCSQYRASETSLGPHYVQPFPFQGNGAEAMTRILAALLHDERYTLVTQTKDYIHATFAGEKLGLVDDVEFLLSVDDKVIHVRSSSRLPLSDFGANRARVKELREAFDELADDEDEEVILR